MIDHDSLEIIRPLRSAIVLFLGLTLIVVDRGILLAMLPFGMGMQLTSLSDHGRDLRTRAIHMSATLLAITIGTALGGVVSHGTWSHIILGAVLALVCGYIGALGAEWLAAGVMLLVVFAIFGGSPITLLTTWKNVSWILAGGVLMIGTMVFEVLVNRALRHSRRTRPAPPPLADRVATVRRHLHWNDRYALHAVRLSVVMTVAIAISETSDFAHAYWIPMTVAWITRPELDGTVDRIILRVIGTVVGLGIAGSLYLAVHPNDEVSIVFASIAAFVAGVFLVPNYAIAVVGVTTFVFYLLHIAGFPTRETVGTRIVATLIGSALVGVAILIRPRSVVDRA